MCFLYRSFIICHISMEHTIKIKPNPPDYHMRKEKERRKKRERKKEEDAGTHAGGRCRVTHAAVKEGRSTTKIPKFSNCHLLTC